MSAKEEDSKIERK